MAEKKKLDRRSAIIALTGIVGLGAGAAAGWVSKPPEVKEVATTTTTTTTTTKEVLKEVIKFPEKIEYSLGLAIAVTGAAYAVEGPFRRDAALLAVEHMNALLKASGSPVSFKVVHEDSKGTAEGAVAAIEALAAAGVKVVVGPLSSGEVRAIKSFVDANKIVSISPSATSPLLAVPDDYVFRMVQTDIPQAKALAQVLGELGYTKVAIMGRADDYGKGIADLFEKIFTDKFRGTVKKLMFTVGQADYATEVGVLSGYVRELGVDAKTAVFLIAFDVDGLNIIGHARLDVTLPKVKWFGSESLKRPTFLPPTAPKETGDFLTAVSLTGLFPSPERSPVTVKFEQEYKAKYGKDPTPYSYYTYDSAWVAMLAILAAAKYDGEAIKKILPRVSENYLGASGYKILDANGDVAGADYRVWRVVLEAGAYKFKDVGVWFFATEKVSWY